jgi:hypothetical protein
MIVERGTILLRVKQHKYTFHTGIGVTSPGAYEAPGSCILVILRNTYGRVETHIVGVIFTVKIDHAVNQCHLIDTVDAEWMAIPNAQIGMLAHFY